MFVNGRKIAKVMDELFPRYRAYSWDNVGFQVGHMDRRVDRVLIALELTDAVIDEAVSQGAEMIITHHPLIFRPLKRLCSDDPIGRLVMRLVEEKILLYSAHTNLDVSAGGSNDMLFSRLGLVDREWLQKEGQEPMQKLAVHAPLSSLDILREALDKAGAGRLGAYEACSFTTLGEGVFRPLDGAMAAIGEVGKTERVEEGKMEVILPKGEALAIVEKVRELHPYETMAYDLWDLDDSISQEPWGIGLLGRLEEPLGFDAFLDHVKERLGIDHLRVVQARNRPVRRVALCTGAGADLIERASSAGADVLITGDLKYHEAMLADSLRLNVVDAGHFATEHLIREGLAELLKEKFEQKHYEVALSLSQSEKDPISIR